jgi:hypothetical protein
VGFLSGASSIVRFVAAPPRRLDREAVAAAVRRRLFRELRDDDAGAPHAFGWIGTHDPLATDLTPADLFYQHYLVVGFRYDRRVVPPKLLVLERRRAEAALAAERGVERIGRAARKQLKLDVEARLLVRALPVPRLFDCVWNLDSGRLYFSGKLRVAREAFCETFAETFGVAPVPLIPYLAVEHMGLGSHTVERVRAAEPVNLALAGSESEAAPVPADVPMLPLEEVVG